MKTEDTLICSMNNAASLSNGNMLGSMESLLHCSSLEIRLRLDDYMSLKILFAFMVDHS